MTAPDLLARDRGTSELPLSFAQQRLWFLNQYEPEGDTQNNAPYAIELRGRLEVDALRAAFQEIARRHALLRTRFGQRDGVPYQVVDPFAEMVIPLAEVDRRELQARIDAHARQRFDLEKGPLWKVDLLRLGPDEHVLLINIHHIASDGPSYRILFNELTALYNAAIHGESIELPVPSIQYADYAASERQWIDGGGLEADLRYWRERLRGAPELLALPADRPRVATATHAGCTIPFQLPRELCDGLKALRRREQTTLFKTLLAAFQVLMWRYSQQTDIVVGAPVSVRDQPLESVVGFFINTLPLRTQIDPDERFSALLARVTATVSEAQEHQAVPFDYLVHELSPQRSLGHNPLVQAVFGFQRAALSTLRLANIEASRLVQDSGAAKFDVTVTAYEMADDIVGWCEYRTSLFDRATIERLLDHYRRLLEAIVADPDERISRYDLLSGEERHRLLIEWNSERHDFPREQTMHGLFEERAAETPDAVALVYEGRHLTYGALNARADQLARDLAARGVGPEVRVGICLERSPEMVIAILGVLKAGGAYVPLDPSYPKARLDYIAADAQVAFVIDQLQPPARLALSEVEGPPADQPPSRRRSAADNLAYVIYTSGSTGQPKGAMLTHRGAVNLAYAQEAYFAPAPGERVLQFAAFGFDASVWELLMAWKRGATLVLAPREQLLPGAALTALINREAIDVVLLPPSALSALSPQSLPRLGTLLLGGETLSPAEVAPWLGRGVVLNAYGPTEATVCTTVHPCSAEDRVVPIGRNLGNTAVYILDAELQPVPVGVSGELCIGGVGLARGYLNRPELTAEKFVPNPFGAAGSRMYRTGDLARYRADGRIEFLGRSDHQVKIRGFRIELGEIEATLARHPAIAQPLVIAAGEGESKHLIAYYTVKGAEAPGAADLRAFLRTTLPEHMVPGFFVGLDAFPLMPNGKIDRAALPAPDVAGTIAERYAAPRTPIEQTLAGIWEQVLHVPRIGIHDNFFEIGGHSLLATQAISRINDAFAVALPVRALFEAPDVESLGRRVAEAQAAGRIARLPLAPVDRGGPLPLSFAQQRLWFLGKLDGASSSFNVSSVLRLRGPLDPDALVRAIQAVVARHEILRTRLGEIDGVPVQVIDAAEDFAVRRDGASAPDTLQALVDEELRHHFDTSRDALFRALLIEEAADASVLVLNMHHSVADGWSLGVLAKEITALYTAFREGRPSPLPPLPIQYADFAHWQREWMAAGEVSGGGIEYWKGALAHLPPLLELPTDRPRPPVQSYVGAQVPFRVPKALTDRLLAVSQRSGATLFMALLAAFDVLLSRYSGQTDIAVGTPVANRTRPEVEPLIGFFINNLVLRADLSGDPTFAALLDQIRETALNAYAHQEVPFDYLVEQLNPVRSLSYAPLFQVMLVLQNAPPATLRLPDVEVTPVAHEQPTIMFDLVFSLTETETGLSGSLKYSPHLFDRATIERLLDHFGRLLEAVAAKPEERISRYELLSDQERQRAVVEWNRNQQPYPRELTMHGLFEAQAALTPDAIALVYENQHLTYRALDERANQLAHDLVARGVGPEVRVGICLERSAELMIAILGVLKAGGAYVPLDPSYPKVRLDYIAADAQVAFVIDHLGGPAALRLRSGQASPAGPLPIQTVGPDNLAYVIYTSGSTGQPKGVMVTHRNVVNLTYAQKTRLAELEGTRVLQFASFSFDGSVWEFVMAWIRGGTLVLGPKERMLPGEGLTALMNEQAIDIATLPPSALTVLRPEALPGLKSLICGGEALSLAQVGPWLAGRKVMNGYGPTESTVDASIGPVSGEDPIPLDRAIPNIALYILDEALQIAPVGVAGEIYIGGEGLARGYLGRPELTAEKFVPNPFGEPGSRMYRTGDVARYRPDGKMEFLGRADHQVKVRGFRIELGEIEAALEHHPAVAQALVIASGEGESKRLIAYYTVTHVESPPPHDLRTFLKATLPEHMVPAFFVSLDDFPLTPNGKIDRAALPAPDVAGTIAEQYVAPRTPVEQALVDIWQQVLHVPRVGVHDNFFEIGGHSLLATQVISRINDAFSLALPIRALFEAADVEALAHRIEGAGAAGRIARLPLVPIDRNGSLPLSFAQQRLWFLSKLEGPSATYNVMLVMRLRGALDEDALIRAIRTIVARHEILRTRFGESDGVPVQVIEPADAFAVDRRVATAPDAVEALVGEELEYPFDISRESLFRALLIDEADAHVLIINMHHVIADAWSFGVFIQELAALYSAFHEGRPSPLPPLAVQYADFAHWQREWLTGHVLEAETEYWKRALAHLPPLLELPTDRPRPAVQSYHGAQVPFSVPKAVTDQLLALSQRSGATLFMTLLAAFDVLLSRYSGQTDIAVGSPVANRLRPEVEPLIGFFINNLVLRADLSGDPTFTALLEQVREVALNAYAHQEIPFDYLVGQLNPARSLSYAPLFQVMLVLQNAPFDAVQLPNLDVSLVPHEQPTVMFDLVFSLTETETGLSGSLKYSPHLFDRTTIGRLLDHFGRLLEAIVAAPEERISRYELLSEEERHQAVVEWNCNQQPYPRELTMHGLFEAQAALTPDAIALVYENQHLTYRALDERANQLAHDLVARGVGPEVRVGICLERSAELMIAILGVLKAGGAYVPLDPSYPKARLDYIAADAQVAFVIDHLGAPAALRLRSGQASPANPDNLAYVIYTSGSTGQPKGVMVTHRNVVNLTYAQKTRLAELEGTRVLQFASFSFDGSVWEFVMAWIRGGTLVLGSKERMLPGEGLTALMNEQAIDIATLPPSALTVLRPEALPGLKSLICGGEALSLAQVGPWLAGRKVMNGYGPTESTVDASIGPVSGEDPIPLDRAIPNIALYILDDALQIAPVGVAGEIYIGGEGLARGYLGRPELTAEKFVPNPFGEPGSRMYRTGDVARYRPDGKMEFLGRADHQVKVRGFRIELGEIEAALERHPAVAQALVIASGEGEERRLIAYYTLQGVDTPSAAELRSLLKTTLPEHMVPAFFMSLDDFPLTPNGKIDRAALPAPDVAGTIAEQYVAPRTPVEQALVDIWQQVLHVPRVGVHDNFFEIGGHSLLATQVISRINDAFSLALPIRALFEAADVEALARRIAESGRIARLPLVPIDRSGPLPLSFAQQRLWFLSKLEGPSATYNVTIALRLRGPLDRDALVRAIETIVARHEVLRTRFGESDGVPMQVIEPAGGFAVRRHRAHTPDAVEARVNEELYYPFDIGRESLFRALLIEEADDAHVLVLNLHHSIGDAWSFGVLMKELAALYGAFREGRPSPLPPLAIQYADFAQWQRGWMAGDVLAGETEYWKGALAHLPPLLELPTDRPRPPVQSYRGADELFRVSKELTDRLAAISQTSGATLFMTLLAAFDVLLGRYSGQADIAVGTPVANRTRSELEPLIGFFINTLVLRADLSGDPTFAELLARVRENALEAYAHQEVPFDYLVGQLNPTRSLSYSPLFQVMFVLQNAPLGSMGLPDLEVTPLPYDQATVMFDLVFSLTETETGLSGSLKYSPHLFDRTTIERLLDHFGRLLEAVTVNPEERISCYELLSDQERQRAVVEWNRNQQSYPRELTMHGLFEAQAALTPDAIALVYENQHLTYRALDERANQLAHDLVARGVGPEVRVGICLERSAELMIAILGVLKAGGAYVPLDPSYPKARLDYIAADAQVAFVIDQLEPPARPPADQPPSRRRAEAGPDNLAYVIYTSGSTGQPKGVMVTHRNVVNLTYAQKTRLAELEGTRVLQFASFSFDGSVWEFVMAWIRGGTLVLGPKERMLPGEGLTALMNEQAIDIATLPPSALTVLRPEALPGLKSLICGGEALSLAQVGPWLAGRKVMNGYGPTESTVDASIGPVSGEDPIPLDRAIPNIALYILDEALQIAPVGVAGEIYIGGEGLARGYLGRPELTAEKFVPNPFGEAGSRMYRTGDVARYRPDGKMEFLGRADHQVKVRGFRIELGEIEAALEHHPAVAQALVIASGEGEERRLIAYYTVTGAEAPSAAELRSLLKTTLPEHMVPAFFVSLDEFPLTPNGKIDRAALPAPDLAGTIAEQYVAPRTPVEQALVDIWQQVLHVPRVGVHDNFFEIGGHSLLVVQAVARMERALDVDLPVIELYKHPTVAALAAHLTEGGEERSPASPLVVISARESGTPLVLIPGIVGVLHGYYDFARALGELRPVYGLHASSAQEVGIHHTVEGIARLYVSSLLEEMDGRPFHLLGHSYGGILAFEMVRQLEQQGRRPGALILVDADPLSLTLKELSPDAFALQYMQRFLRLDDDAVLPDDERMHQWVRTIQSRYVDAHVPRPYQPAAQVLEIWAQHGALLRAAETMPAGGARSAWQEILQKPTDSVVVPGDHESVIGREHAARLARMVNEWIEEKVSESLPLSDGLSTVISPPR